jgi:diguanylate cyclase (GGDEF)-like protein
LNAAGQQIAHPMVEAYGMQKDTPPEAGLRRGRVPFARFLGTFAIGLVDYLSEAEIGLALFYLLPIVGCAWWLGTRPAAICAVAASITWLLADTALRTDDYLNISLWNGLTRLGIFLSLGLVIARLRRQNGEIADLDNRLRHLLDQESRLARTDSLTGLPNSRAFLEALRVETARARRAGRALSVAYVDVDNFKQVNDRLGHEEGDQLLALIAATLRDAVRTEDVTARLAGDEFAILFDDTRSDRAEEIGHRIIDRVADLSNRYAPCRIGATIGIAHFPSPPSEVDEIMRQVDSVMYEAKAMGKGQLKVWSAEPTQVTR